MKSSYLKMSLIFIFAAVIVVALLFVGMAPKIEGGPLGGGGKCIRIVPLNILNPPAILNVPVSFRSHFLIDASGGYPQGCEFAQVTAYIWNFGDGSSVETHPSTIPEHTVTHTYDNLGTYEVTVTVETSNVGNWPSDPLYVRIVENPEFTPGPNGGVNEETPIEIDSSAEATHTCYSYDGSSPECGIGDCIVGTPYTMSLRIMGRKTTYKAVSCFENAITGDIEPSAVVSATYTLGGGGGGGMLPQDLIIYSERQQGETPSISPSTSSGGGGGGGMGIVTEPLPTITQTDRLGVGSLGFEITSLIGIDEDSVSLLLNNESVQGYTTPIKNGYTLRYDLPTDPNVEEYLVVVQAQSEGSVKKSELRIIVDNPYYSVTFSPKAVEDRQKTTTPLPPVAPGFTTYDDNGYGD